MKLKMQLSLVVLGVVLPLVAEAGVMYHAVPHEKTGSVLIFPARRLAQQDQGSSQDSSSDARAILSQQDAPLKSFNWSLFGIRKGQHHHGYGHLSNYGDNQYQGGYYHGYGEYPISGYPQYYGHNYNGFGWGHGGQNGYAYYPNSDRPYEYGYEG